MSYSVTASKRAEVTENNLSENRGRARKRRFMTFQHSGNSCSTPVKKGKVHRKTINDSKLQISVSAERRSCLRTSLVDVGLTTQDFPFPMDGKFNSFYPPRTRSWSTSYDLGDTSTSFMAELSTDDMSGVRDVSAFSEVSSSYCSSARCQSNARSNHGTTKKQKFVGSVRAGLEALTKRLSGSMAGIHRPSCEVETDQNDSQKTPTQNSQTPTNSNQMEQIDIEYGDFVAAGDHPDFQDTPRQNLTDNGNKVKRRPSSFSARSLFRATRKSLGELKARPRSKGRMSKMKVERNVKKRRASDINLREIFGSSAKGFSRREKNLRIAENCSESQDFPDVKKLPLSKTIVKSPTTGARLSISLNELLKCKAGSLRFRAFLQSEFSEENLDFWIECDAYKHRRLHKQRKLAPKIYDKYLAVNAPFEVNLDAMTRRKTKAGMDCPDTNTFDLAQTKIFELMEGDSFKRFKQSLAMSKT